MRTRLFYLLLLFSCFCASAQTVFSEDFSSNANGIPNGWALTGNVTCQGGNISSNPNSNLDEAFVLKSPNFSLIANQRYTFHSFFNSFLEDGTGNITPKEVLFHRIKGSNNNTVVYFSPGTSDANGSYELNEIFTVSNSGSYYIEAYGAIENLSNPKGSHQNLDMTTIEIKVESSLSNVEYDYYANDVNVYPNPVNYNLKIKTLSDLQIKQVELYNLTGKKIKTTTLKTILVSDLANGIYLLKLITDKGITTKKILKI